MSISVHIPVNEYLKTMYRPDCDYVEGEVLERNWGDMPHALVQSTIADIFRRARQRTSGLIRTAHQNASRNPHHRASH